MVLHHAIFENEHTYCAHSPRNVLALSPEMGVHQEGHFGFSVCMNEMKSLNKREGEIMWFFDVYFFQCTDCDDDQLSGSFGKWDPYQVNHCW